MEQKVTTSPDFVVRPLAASAEIETFMYLAAETFAPTLESVAERALRRRKFFTESPYFDASQLRGAFLGSTFLGGYTIGERTLCIGPARLLTGCIGAVVTRLEHRSHGVDRAMLQDALHYGYSRRHALLLLDGVGNFYHRFGFIDVLDLMRYVIDSKDALSLPPGHYSTRPATPGDVPALLDLYQRHYNHYLGSFVHTLAYQELLYRYRISPILAVSPDEVPHGYIMITQQPGRLNVHEVAADNWPAVLALLHYHATLQAQVLPQESELEWPLPPDSPTFYILSDHLPLRGQVYHRPNADWMARPGHLATLMQALLPLLSERWQQSNFPWSGTIALTISDEIYVLDIAAPGVSLADHSTPQTRQVTLSQQVFTQLLFSYRPVFWALYQPGSHIPDDLVGILGILFPKAQAWIPGSDAF